jgi:hypothetical protein
MQQCTLSYCCHITTDRICSLLKGGSNMSTFCYRNNCRSMTFNLDLSLALTSVRNLSIQCLDHGNLCLSLALFIQRRRDTYTPAPLLPSFCRILSSRQYTHQNRHRSCPWDFQLSTISMCRLVRQAERWPTRLTLPLVISGSWAVTKRRTDRVLHYLIGIIDGRK